MSAESSREEFTFTPAGTTSFEVHIDSCCDRFPGCGGLGEVVEYGSRWLACAPGSFDGTVHLSRLPAARALRKAAQIRRAQSRRESIALTRLYIAAIDAHIAVPLPFGLSREHHRSHLLEILLDAETHEHRSPPSHSS